MQPGERLLQEIQAQVEARDGDPSEACEVESADLGNRLKEARAEVLGELFLKIGGAAGAAARTSRDLRWIRSVNRVIREADSEKEALEAVLSVFVREGDFLAGIAWEPGGRQPVRIAGCAAKVVADRVGEKLHRDHIHRFLDTLQEERPGLDNHPALIALEKGCCVREPFSSLNDRSWAQVRTQARVAGIRTLAAVPLQVLEEQVAVLELYGEDGREQEPAERDLFRELGEQAAHGLLRKRMETAQATQLALLNATVESTPTGVMAVSRDGRILFWNRRFADLWGIDLDLLESGDYERVREACLLRLTEPERFRRRIEDRYMSENQEVRDELVFLDGKVVERCCRPLFLEDGRVGRVWTLHDVTAMRNAEKEQRELREQLLHSQKMEAVGQLAGGVAHDFNNVLTAIKGYADLLLKRIPETGGLQRYAREIRNASVRAEGLTRQLLAFSRRQTVDPKTIDLNRLVSGMEGMIRRLIRADVDLVLDLSPTPCRTVVDAGRVEQVLMNLVVNARDALGAGGADEGGPRIRLATRALAQEPAADEPVPEVPAGRYVELQVQDNGCGMEKELVDRIFEPFFTTKPAGEGTGLGLSIVYGVVKQCGGCLKVESEPGAGTTIHVLLPEASEESENGPGFQGGNGDAAGSETVLLVEDEDMVRRLTRSILEAQGYRVLEAANREQALDHADHHEGRIDLVLSDVVMPGKNGPEIYREILSRRSGARVLYMSGYAREVIDDRGFIPEAAGFLQKPFAPETLLSQVRESLDG